MPIQQINQPEIILVDEHLRLRKTSEREAETALHWYQNPQVLLFSEGVTDEVYDLAIVTRMYQYLSSMGELYFIEICEGEWRPIGDEAYWGKGIGKRVITALIERARIIGLGKIFIPFIYKYNERSRNLFTGCGFIKVAENEVEDAFELRLS